MRLTRTDRTLFVVTIALMTYLVGSDLGTRPEPVAPSAPKPTALHFGDTSEDTRIVRPKKIGTTEGPWTSGVDPDVSYTLRYMGAGVRASTAKYTPTDEEFDAWLLLPDEHPLSSDLDGYVESLR